MLCGKPSTFFLTEPEYMGSWCTHLKALRIWTVESVEQEVQASYSREGHGKRDNFDDMVTKLQPRNLCQDTIGGYFAALIEQFAHLVLLYVLVKALVRLLIL